MTGLTASTAANPRSIDEKALSTAMQPPRPALALDLNPFQPPPLPTIGICERSQVLHWPLNFTQLTVISIV